MTYINSLSAALLQFFLAKDFGRRHWAGETLHGVDNNAGDCLLLLTRQATPGHAGGSFNVQSHEGRDMRSRPCCLRGCGLLLVELDNLNRQPWNRVMEVSADIAQR